MTYRTLGTLLMVSALTMMSAPTLRASDVEESVVKAKALYESAAYEEALAVLANATSPDAYQYRALCLVALGRIADAENELAALVTISPAFVVRDEDMPPRFLVLFAEARRKVVPPLLRQLFEQARQQYQNKSYQQALEGFERVSALASDRLLSEEEGMKDLALLASGFVDLVRSSIASPTSAPAVEPPSAPAVRAASPPAGRAAEPAGRAPAPATAAASPPATAAAAEDRAGIQATLDMYASGYSRLDAAAIKRIYPGIDEQRLQRGFGAYRSQQVQVRVEGIQMTGPTTANVTTLQTTTASMQVGGMHRDTRQIMFRLERQNGSWIILEHR
jgi:tetratricopeptide (TPR) repeat protein